MAGDATLVRPVKRVGTQRRHEGKERNRKHETPSRDRTTDRDALFLFSGCDLALVAPLRSICDRNVQRSSRLRMNDQLRFLSEISGTSGVPMRGGLSGMGVSVSI